MIRKMLSGVMFLAVQSATIAHGADYGRPPLAASAPATRAIHRAHGGQSILSNSSMPGTPAIRTNTATHTTFVNQPSSQVVAPTSFIDSSLACSDGSCGGASCTSCSGGDVFYESCDDPCMSDCHVWSAGVEFTLLKAHFENNVAFTQMESNGTTFENFTDVEFNYDTGLAPRIWLERMGSSDLGLRVIYWQFDEEATQATGTPAANGFGRIFHPTFGDVDLSTTIPNSRYTSDSDLNAYSIDFEGTKYMSQGMWRVVTSGGLRLAEVEQNYRSTLTSAQGQTQGTINFGHTVQGVGPTIAVRTTRPFSPRLSLFATGRGSLLFGDGQSTLTAVEDQDLANAFTTQRITDRNDILPVGEVQVGFEVTPVMSGMWQPYVHVAMEGQLWSGAGNASSETGNLGFYGLNVAVGFDW